MTGIGDELAHRAGELAEEHSLRGYDAVNLASALATGDTATVISWDQNLRRGAIESGLAVAPPAV